MKRQTFWLYRLLACFRALHWLPATATTRPAFRRSHPSRGQHQEAHGRDRVFYAPVQHGGRWSGRHELWTARGGGRSPVVSLGSSRRSRRWSPIAFSRNTDVGVTSVYVMNVDGSGTTPVAQGIVLNPGPVWSPSGCEIAFPQQPGNAGRTVSAESRSSTRDGTGLRQISPEPGPNEFAFDESPRRGPPTGRGSRSPETGFCMS